MNNEASRIMFHTHVESNGSSAREQHATETHHAGEAEIGGRMRQQKGNAFGLLSVDRHLQRRFLVVL